VLHSQQPKDVCGEVGDISSSSQEEICVSRRSQYSIKGRRLSPGVTQQSLPTPSSLQSHAAGCMIYMGYNYPERLLGCVCCEQSEEL